MCWGIYSRGVANSKPRAHDYLVGRHLENPYYTLAHDWKSILVWSLFAPRITGAVSIAEPFKRICCFYPLYARVTLLDNLPKIDLLIPGFIVFISFIPVHYAKHYQVIGIMLSYFCGFLIFIVTTNFSNGVGNQIFNFLTKKCWFLINFRDLIKCF